MRILRWLARYFGTLLTAFILAIIVWVSAVVASDPNRESPLQRPIPIEVIGQDSNLQVLGDLPRTVSVVLRAPTSVWTQLNTNSQLVRAFIDLSNLGAGVHEVPVQVQITPRLVRLISQNPEKVTITLDSIDTKSFPVNLVVQGTPPVGYQAQTPLLNPSNVTVSGPVSLVSRISEVRLTLDITNANQTIVRNQTPVLLDADNKVVEGLTVTPDTVTITQPIALLGGYRYVIVRAISTGQVASGYRLTNIFVTPVGVVVFSSDPTLVNDLPGYVETQPIDLTGKTDDFEDLISLNLPDGISVVGDPKVLVQVSVAAIESSLAISLPVEVIGLAPGQAATASPTTVNVILSGPVPILNTLSPDDVRVTVDVTGYALGTYQLIPVVNILPDQVQKVSMVPATVEVTIAIAPTPTITPTPNKTVIPLANTPTPKP